VGLEFDESRDGNLMPKKPDLPPELGAAIELTAEFREAMGIIEPLRSEDPVAGVPSDEELARFPEWYAVNAWITAEEYLSCFGYSDQPIQLMRNGKAGENPLWKRPREKK
jgi:hypothetical protein